MTDDYKALVSAALRDQATFVRLTLKGIVRGPAVPWQKITIRPVRVRDRHQLQFSYFDGRHDHAKNYYGDEAMAQLGQALSLGFSAIVLQTTSEDVQIQLTKKGKALIHRHHRAPGAAPTPDTAHNRAKAQPLAPDQPDAFLQALGIMAADGQIRPAMQAKFAQINEFIKLVEATGELERFAHTPIELLDCGCGSSHLTFALHHYLNHLRGLPARLVGIDSNAQLIEKCTAQAAALQIERLAFAHTPIADFQPEHAPDLVLALHACDTATDDAIGQAIRHQAHMLVCAPCCHHQLNDQIDNPLFRPVLRHGILRQRTADILTDTFRALILRIMGYRAEVIEFVAAEHTAKNLMIRAVRRTAPGERQFVREYNQLKQFWGVTPYLETLLGDQLTRWLDDASAESAPSPT
ncbi:MAG: SAM-dependent methyltransferase [Kouleothrix sp.]|jgi:hypothetical protein|nr:SAM-dependent methyltransferase [Kouleothrix sp.]